MARPTWDATWMTLAHAMAKRSLCVRAQVGCVVVDRRNRCVATGYNGPPSGFIHNDLPCTEWCERAGFNQPLDRAISATYEDCPALHSELSALLVGDRSTREGGTIYVSGHVCHGCAKAIANSGLTTVVVDVTEPRDYRHPERSYELLEACGVTVVEYQEEPA